MIPDSIIQYLQRHQIPFERRPHLRAITAQALAATLHVSGFQVAKTVILHAQDRLWLCVTSAPDTLDLGRVSEMLGVRRLRLAEESEFAELFPECEVGAEPPFGQLYGLPVLVDEHLRQAERLWFRAGSHAEAIELAFEDFIALEEPLLGHIVRDRPGERAHAPMEMHG
ncbi:YbaK/EbsC family protein [Pyxidicoccus fallax]|uniref:YbaK/EbsC family protein n=1 Tax=Pyxidicoccus fallax TaxID=394095 RepID=A0A848LEM1_9BACT|nr:YbaK/EbsC family protein [Pyxidicoccus fallax]NMO16692.1 YbaK/EbsC family protein [Pyxidicoccus fallax]NPC83049.1 YbaK/EbsC family protein [Pyxidicoccus fallax]